MEDMERYGDYNEVDEEPGGRSIVGIVLKVLIALIIVSVIAVLAIRISLFNNYPAEVSRVIWTDDLAAYYAATGGDIGAKYQSTRLSYDDPKEGNFFFGELVVVPGADHLQVTVRYNTSLMQSIKERYGIELDPDADPFDIFEFTLVRTASGYTPEDGADAESFPTEAVGTLGATKSASNMMYRYARVAFDGVDFGFDEGETPVGWYRLEIRIKGTDKPPYMLPVYTTNLELEDYKLGRGEVPDR